MLVFNFGHLTPVIDDLTIAWSYGATLASVLYRPSQVFKQFSFIQLLDDSLPCACSSTSRFAKFKDQLTVLEISRFSKPTAHVRTMDLRIIQNKLLRYAVAQGLNHIPL